MITPHFMSAVGPSHGIERRWDQPASYETFPVQTFFTPASRASLAFLYRGSHRRRLHAGGQFLFHQ